MSDEIDKAEMDFMENEFCVHKIYRGEMCGQCVDEWDAYIENGERELAALRRERGRVREGKDEIQKKAGSNRSCEIGLGHLGRNVQTPQGR